MFQVVIPARFASSRFPGKPLAEIAGMPMLAHVIQQAKASGAAGVYVATDDIRILELANAMGAQGVMTSANCNSGTERIVEVVRLLKWAPDTIVVNVQGDEPTIPFFNIQYLATVLEKSQASVATLYSELTDEHAYHDPNVVKVVLDKYEQALYFSRAPIPYHRAPAVFKSVKRHIGLYAYRVSALEAFMEQGPSLLEDLEMLEQLRFLWHAFKIQLACAPLMGGPAVDVPSDIQAVETWMQLNPA